MKCEEARRYLGPYLDSELDPKTSYEIARHLENCPSCAERFASEERVERAVARELRKPEAGDDELWKRALAGAAPRRRWRILASAAAAALVLALGWFVVSGRDGLAEDLRKDHLEIQSGRAVLDIASSDPAEVSGFFRDRMGLNVPIEEIPGGELVGGRKCALRGVPTAFLLYRVDGRPVSVSVFGADRLERFPESLDVPLMDEGHDVKVAAVRSRHHVVAAAGRIPCDRLLRICQVLINQRR